MRFHVIYPAAGVGSRFGSEIPKQYVEALGRPVMAWTLDSFQSQSLNIDQQVIALSDDDRFAEGVLGCFPQVTQVAGGAERSISVMNGLSYLSSQASLDDWVLVHDIARPCLNVDDVKRLIDSCRSSGVGGVLGHPSTDTVKLSDQGHVVKTLNRDQIWTVQTPQCFQVGQLIDALRYCQKNEITVTDEASAIEAVGGRVNLIRGSSRNIKLTHADDLELIEFLIQKQRGK